jgi:hypothetical protein
MSLPRRQRHLGSLSLKFAGKEIKPVRGWAIGEMQADVTALHACNPRRIIIRSLDVCVRRTKVKSVPVPQNVKSRVVV